LKPNTLIANRKRIALFKNKKLTTKDKILVLRKYSFRQRPLIFIQLVLHHLLKKTLAI